VLIARGILGLAWPILIAQLAVMAYAVVDTVLVGHATPADLAAMGVGASVYGSVFVSLTGVLNALNPIIGQEFGAGRDRAVGASLVQGLWVAVLLSVAGMAPLTFAQVWLPYLNAAPDVQALAAGYLRVVSLALPASLVFRAFYAFNTAISRPRVMMALVVVGLALKVLLSAVLVFGQLGVPRLGVLGAAVASVLVYWLLCLAALLYTRLHAANQRFLVRLDRPRWTALREQLRLGVPMGLGSALENTSFSMMTLFVAGLGTSVLGGHQIVMNLTALAYQVPLALAVATATLTAQAIGARDLCRARTVAWWGIGVCAFAAAFTASSVWTLRGSVVGLYTSDAAVAAVALSLVGYFAALHVFDALQGATAFVLRAYRIAVVPTVIYAVALWGPGLIGGYLVAFGPHLGGPRGVQGLWLMLAASLAFTACLLLSFYVWMLRRVPLSGDGGFSRSVDVVLAGEEDTRGHGYDAQPVRRSFER
jgi:MATE family multidrug resistance protein